MRWLFRWLFRLLILLVVLVVAALLLLDTVAREITENRIQQQTGLETKIGRMHVSLLQPKLTVENLVIYNSAEFGGSPLLEAPEVHLECDRNPFFHPNFHFKFIRLDWARLNVVEDAQGRKNLDLIGKQLKKSPGIPGLPSAPKAPAGGTNTNSFPQIDTMNVSLGRATYVNMKNPGKVDVLNLDIHNQIYTGLTSETQVKNILLVILLSRENVLGGEGEHWLDVFGLKKKKTAALKSSP